MNMLSHAARHVARAHVARPDVTRTLPLVLALTLAASAAWAQPDTAPATPDAVRDALKKKEGDVDQGTLLKDTLTATEKQYSLLKSGKVAATYDLGYAYIGSQVLNVKFADSLLTQFALENTRSHTVTNSATVDYGVLDNLTASVSLPLVSKYTNTNDFNGITNGLGDIAVSARWQPFELRRDGPTTSLTGSLRLPTGRSPFKTIVGHDLATGSGYAAGTVGVNLSKIVDPVALFGSVNFTLADAARNLSQQRDAKTLRYLRPGPSLGFGGGFAYALSYDISTTLSFQETVSAPSRLLFTDGTSAKTAMQVSGVMNIGFGVRTSPRNTINFALGIGLTTESPNFTLSMSMPMSFGSLF